MPRWRRIVALAVGVLVVLSVAVWMFRDKLTGAMLFHPERGQWRSPADIGLDYEALMLTAADGTRTEAWWLPGAGDGPVIVFFHGNAGTMADRLDNARALVDLGASVLLAEYRGYGNSEGRPSERGLYADAQAAVREARRRAGDRPLVAFGRSLGGAVAIDVATREPVDALVVESTFTSLPALARELLRLPGIAHLVAYDFDSLDKIRSLRAPILVIHGGADELIPFSMGEELARAAPDATLHRVPSGTHNDTWLAGGGAYWTAWRTFLDRLR